MPTSIWPSAILLATGIAAWRPVPHACCTSVAGVAGDSWEPSTDSRVRLKSRECLRTAPGDDLTEALALQAEAGDETVERGGEHVLVGRVGVGEFERANGMRLPPMTATRRVLPDERLMEQYLLVTIARPR